MKGFIDRVFLPGFAFEKRENSVWWDKLLTKKTARIISTLDQPAWYYRLIFSRPSYKSLKNMTLQFSGIKNVAFSDKCFLYSFKYIPIPAISKSPKCK